jgi:outer membrane biosynthesis protein TonB
LKSPIILRIFKDSKLQEVKQFERDQIIFGKEGDIQVELKDDSVSIIHCLIELRDSGYYICDLGSQTGTFKNGQQVLDEAISSGDQIKIGPYTIHFFVGIPKPAAPPVTVSEKKTEIPIPPPPARATMPAGPPVPPTPSVPVAPPTVDSSKISSPVESIVKQPPRLPDGPKSESKKDSHYVDKSHKTFAPPSEIKSLDEYLKPTKGPWVQVIVAWKERVLVANTYEPNKKIKSSDIIPPGFLLVDSVIVDTTAGCTIFAPPDSVIEFLNQKRTATGTVRLEQGEVAMINLSQGTLKIYIRYVAETKKPLFAPFLDFSSSELTGMIASLVIVALTALYMSVYTPPEPEKKEEEEIRMAQFVYNKPKEVVKVEETPPPPPPPQKPPEEKKVIKVADKQQEQVTKAPPKEKQKADQPAARAAEVKTIPNSQNRPKKFTSTNQGGAVKIGEKAGASAQTQKDVSKTGLMAAFGGGGIRKELDRASSGAGDLIGMANEASGSAGQNENRAGDDIGSKFKDTGAGGKGTATAGISGIGTKGRSSGQSAYGGLGVGGKGSVAIEGGGAEAEFIGTIDREAVRRVVRSKLNEIKNCYERALNTNKELEGKVVIRFIIEEQGRVKIANTKSTTLNNRQVEECVATRIKNAIFPEPPPGTVAEVDYPFVFGAQN